ncbi:MAG: hypothetical protein IJJ52_02285 [Lachnospiraceae bacterium]|nr:hypothetical protein [Lachnospiraceae bacterium]
MGDSFYELIVRVQPNPTDFLKKAGLIILTVLSFLAGFLIMPLFLGLFMLLAVADFYFFPRFRKEYEYSYVNGDVDIAVIYSKQSRKELASISLTTAECIAPAGSHALDSYGNTYKVIDYTSGSTGEKVYAAVTDEGGRKKILLHLSDEMLKDLQYRVPRKLFLD